MTTTEDCTRECSFACVSNRIEVLKSSAYFSMKIGVRAHAKTQPEKNTRTHTIWLNFLLSTVQLYIFIRYASWFKVRA